ncbi:MAG: phosphate signaling complex protein PhoU [Actinomycetota bacterium]
MREAFQEQLDEITDRLVAMARTAGQQIARATDALLEADIQLADQTVSADATINRDQLEIDEQVSELLARQAPVARDLRLALSALRNTADIERMGDLAVHVAKIVRMYHPHAAVPEEFRDTFRRMGETAASMADKASTVLRQRDVDTAMQLSRDDDEMDRLHRSLFRVMFDSDWDRGVETAVNIALLGRYYERFADHAVHIGTHVRYLVTGEAERADSQAGH